LIIKNVQNPFLENAGRFVLNIVDTFGGDSGITGKYRKPEAPRSTRVAEQLHCLLHLKELKITKPELKRQLKGCWTVAGRLLDSCWKAGNTAASERSEINEA